METTEKFVKTLCIFNEHNEYYLNETVEEMECPNLKDFSNNNHFQSKSFDVSTIQFGDNIYYFKEDRLNKKLVLNKWGPPVRASNLTETIDPKEFLKTEIREYQYEIGYNTLFSVNLDE